MNLDCYALRVPRAAAALDCSTAKVWDMIARGKLAYVRDDGTTWVIANFSGEAPPREGRAPTINELLVESLSAVATKPMPEGVHQGRPRKRSVAAE